MPFAHYPPPQPRPLPPFLANKSLEDRLRIGRLIDEKERDRFVLSGLECGLEVEIESLVQGGWVEKVDAEGKKFRYEVELTVALDYP